MEILLIIGKVLFGALFVGSGISHFKALDFMTNYATYKKIPFARFGVIVSGAAIIVAPILFVKPWMKHSVY